MKNHCIIVLILVFAASGEMAGYEYLFKNFSPKDITIKMQSAGVDEEPIYVELPAMQQGKPGEFLKKVNNLLCLKRKAFKIIDKNDTKNPEKAFDFDVVLAKPGMTSKQRLKWLMNNPDKLTSFRAARPSDADINFNPAAHAMYTNMLAFTDDLICFDRIFVVFQLSEYLFLLITHE